MTLCNPKNTIVLTTLIAMLCVGCDYRSWSEIYHDQRAFDGLINIRGLKYTHPNDAISYNQKEYNNIPIPVHDRLMLCHKPYKDKYGNFYTPIIDLDFSTDGKFIFAATRGGYQSGIQMWPTQTVEPTKAWDPDSGWHFGSRSINTSADSNYFLASQANWAEFVDIRLLEKKSKQNTYCPNSGEFKHFSCRHPRPVCDTKLSPCEKYAATCSVDAAVRLWDMEFGGMIHEFLGHTAQIQAIDYTPDGKYIFSASLDSTVRQWDIESKQCLRVLNQHAGSIWTIQVSPAGNIAISAGSDGCKIWDVDTGENIGNFAENINITDIDFSPDGQFIISGSTDGHIRLWDINALKCIYKIKLDEPVSSVAISPDGAEAVSNGASGLILHWNLRNIDGYYNSSQLKSFKKIPEFYELYTSHQQKKAKELLSTMDADTYPSAQLERMSFFADSLQHCESAKKKISKALEYNNLTKASQLLKHVRPRLTFPQIYKLGKLIDSRRVKEWKPGDFTEYEEILKYDGEIIEFKHADGTASIWDAIKKQKLFSYIYKEVNNVCLSPDKTKALVLTSKNNTHMQLFDLKTKEMLWDVHNILFYRPLHTDKVYPPKFSPDGQYIVTCGSNSWLCYDARIWETATGKKLHTLSGQHWVYNADISPDNKYVATGSQSETFVLWNMKTGKYIWVKATCGETDIKFNNDGASIISYSDEKMEEREIPSGKRRFMSRSATCFSLARIESIPNNERYLLAISDRHINIFDKKTNKWIWHCKISDLVGIYYKNRIQGYIAGQNAIFVQGKKDVLLDLSGITEENP